MTSTPGPGNDAYTQALDFLYDRINYEKLAGGAARYPFRLRRMSELLRRLGLSSYLYPKSAAAAANNRCAVPLVHIAGTKGKGSTATMVAASLSAAGMKTGLYTSPHLHHLEERFRINGAPCSQAEVTSLVERVRPVTEQLAAESIGSPSFFELTTAIALLHFDTRECDAIVMEVGLGGRLDSTNVCWPMVTAITSIGLDHQHVLGDTLSKIAAEKAGIIKTGIPVVSGVRNPEPADVIERVAADKQAPLFLLGREFEFDWQAADDWGSRLRYRGLVAPLGGQLDAELKLEGRHQASNASLAIAITHLLRGQLADHFAAGLNDRAIVRAIGELDCDGRIERFRLADDVLGIVDAAHNEDSIRALCDCLRRRAGVRRVAVVFGTSIDKSAGPMLGLLGEVADDLFLTRFLGNPRSRPPEDLQPMVPQSLVAETVLVSDPIDACRAALDRVTPGGMLVVCGSFFLAAETRGWLAEQTLRVS